ncbi:hypothetical protein MAR_015095 [Mya arenaria]|uniref:IRS-type PTB domain-containing protein n=1 Tax=Mya arenaria TaxID=6604 RepID=A0ABY7FJN5_MYAAR|nr:hypothetical protein MAR_015095 [Mya arenaria]
MAQSHVDYTYAMWTGFPDYRPVYRKQASFEETQSCISKETIDPEKLFVNIKLIQQKCLPDSVHHHAHMRLLKRNLQQLLDILHVIVDDMFDVREVKSLASDVRGNQDILLPLPKLINGLSPLFLRPLLFSPKKHLCEAMFTKAANVQKFAVIVEPSPLAKLCGVEGEMTIMLSDQQTMRFEDSKTHKSMYSFQLAWMRRFGKKGPSHFYFECGRKCPNGEGTVTCQTESARAMHKAITQLSKSRSDIVIPKKKEGKHSKEPAEELRTSTGQITAPSHALNVRRNHPGMQKMPILIPIKQPSNGDATFYEDAPSSPLRSSAGSGGSPVEAPSRSSGKSKSKPDIVQELTEKVGSMIKKDDQKSIKSKDELKKEKKEKERREKEEKKERERKEKEEKREKEKREKDEKKKSKKIESTDMPVKKRSKERIYDEPEIDYDNNQVVDDTYDTAISPTPDTKQQPAKKRSVIKPDLLYEDAEPACNNAASAQNAVEYAQPYIKKGGVPIPAQGVEYAEVGNINKAAWKEQGRTDEETIHEENYSNIKEAREEISNPPSLPERRYNEDDDDDDGENMYNTANLIPGKAKRHDNKKPENIYGIKSAKPAGPIMPDPAADYSSAEEEEEEEGDYAVAEEAPGYEDPKSLMNTNTRASAPIDGAYEETELAQAKPVKPSKIPPKPMSMKKPHPVIPQPQESLYEVVDKK